MKILILWVVLFLSAALSFSQEISFESVAEGFSKMPVTTGKFSQVKTLASSGRNLKSSGSFIFSLEGIVWKTEKPFASTLAITHSRIIQTMADGRRNVTDISGNETFKNVLGAIIAIFSGDATSLNKNFDMEFKDAGSGRWELSLSPKDSSLVSVIRSVTMAGTLLGDTTEITLLSMYEASGDRISYSFSEYAYSQELSADELSYFAD